MGTRTGTTRNTHIRHATCSSRYACQLAKITIAVGMRIWIVAALFVAPMQPIANAASTIYGLEDRIQAIAIDPESAQQSVVVRMSESVSFSFTVQSPRFVQIDIRGDVTKELPRPNTIGVAGVSVIDRSTERYIPEWAYNDNYDEKTKKTDHAIKTYFLQKGDYNINIKGYVPLWRDEAEFRDHELKVKLRITSKNNVPQPEWISKINEWFHDIGLQDSFHIVAAFEEHAFLALSEDLKYGEVGSAFVRHLDRKKALESQLYPRSKQSGEAVGSADSNSNSPSHLFFYIASRLNRGSLREFELQFLKKHSVSFWGRVFRKISLLSDKPSKRIVGFTPVYCGPELLLEGRPGVVGRGGIECSSSSHARDVPAWLTGSLVSAAISEPDGGQIRFLNAVEAFLEEKTRVAGGTLKYIYRDQTYIEAVVHGVRGWVVRGGNQWEKVQIAFSILGSGDSSKVRIFVDGMLASGIGSVPPPDSKFTYSMEPKYASQLSEFAQTKLDEFLRGNRNAK